jgi:hypothetical protein
LSALLGLAAAVLAAAPLPRVAAHADASVFIPRLDKLEALGAFASRAGERTTLFRPSSWTPEFHPLLPVDPTRRASLTAAGMDPAGDATVSWIREGKLSCVSLADAALFQKRADERLAELGTVTRKSDGGVTLVTTALETTVRAGYALEGRTACSFTNGGPTSLAGEAQKRAKRGAVSTEWQRALSLPGVAFGIGRGVTVGVRSTPSVLTVAGKGGHWPLPALRAPGLSPYGAMTPTGLLFARAEVDPRAVPDLAHWLAGQVATVCSGCAPGSLDAVAEKLAVVLTGNVLLRVDRAEVTRPLKTPAGRFFALRQASLAELAQPEAAAGLLAAVGQLSGARAEGEGFILPVTGGELLVGVHGVHLYIANDLRALKSALDASSANPGKQAHALEAWVDPALVAKALRQVSLLDVMTSEALASLFALGTEVGPLLGITAHISAWVDGAGDTQRGEMTWALQPEKSAP